MTHPVINDEDMAMWRGLGVSSWPSVAVVSPQGRLLTLLAGERHERDVDDFVAAALELYRERGELRDGTVPQVCSPTGCQHARLSHGMLDSTVGISLHCFSS